MGNYIFAVYTNPVEGREDEYNDWYETRHLADLYACPGIVSARRFKIAQHQLRDAPFPYRYFSIYEIQSEDLQEFIKELLARAGTELMPRSEALASENSAFFWQAM